MPEKCSQVTKDNIVQCRLPRQELLVSTPFGVNFYVREKKSGKKLALFWRETLWYSVEKKSTSALKTAFGEKWEDTSLNVRCRFKTFHPEFQDRYPRRGTGRFNKRLHRPRRDVLHSAAAANQMAGGTTPKTTRRLWPSCGLSCNVMAAAGMSVYV